MITLPEILFYVALAVQLIYWLVWLAGIVKIKPPTPRQGEGISVVVAARNELTNLQKLIPALLGQQYSTFEVIIVNDRSTDGSFDFLQSQQAKHPRLKVLHIDTLPNHVNAKKYALTLGIKAAGFNQLVFTDADCMPTSPQWLACFAGAWDTRTQVVLGYSAYQQQPGLLNYFIRFETILTGIQYLGAAALGNPYMGVGRNLSYSKALFMANKGFLGFQHVQGGDDDLWVNKYATQSNTRWVLGSQANTLSLPKSSIKAYLRQKTRHLAAGTLYSQLSKWALGLFSVSWILAWLMLPWLLANSMALVLAIVLWTSRLVLMAATFYLFSQKSDERFNLLGLILLDFSYVLYYFVAGARALSTKHIKWS